MDQIKITGPHACSTDNTCTKPPSLSTPCGKKCWFDIDSNKGKKTTFEYTFRGEMFQIYGTYDNGHGSYFVYVDGDKVAEVSQKRNKRELYQLQYTSDLLLYGDHTILVETNNADIELYKFVNWPAVKGARLNSTDLRPFWNVESDELVAFVNGQTKILTKKKKKQPHLISRRFGFTVHLIMVMETSQ